MVRNSFGARIGRLSRAGRYASRSALIVFIGDSYSSRQFLVKDPVNIPGVTEYILTTLQSVSPEEEGECLVNSLDTGSGATAPSSGDTGPSIQDLPIEIIRQVCADLPLCAILSLRLSCRDFRQRIAMDQAFYRSQLLSGHFFALDLNLGLVRGRWSEIKDKDWRRLVKDLARYENFYAGEGGGSSEPGKLRDAPIGLKNRMRILKIVQDIFTGP